MIKLLEAVANIAGTSYIPASIDSFMYISLHTSHPGSKQSNNEASYAGYARVAIPRDHTEWMMAHDDIITVNGVEFPEHKGSATEVITHFGIGFTPDDSKDLLAAGEMNPPIRVSNGVIPLIDFRVRM